MEHTYTIENNNIPDELFEPLPDSEKSTDVIVRQSKTFAKDAWDRFKRNRLSMAGLIIITIITLFAIFAPIFSKHSYETQNPTNGNQPPSSEHFFGTDKFGRDIFIRTMYGARISLTIGYGVAIINVFIGIIYGGIAGYIGGRTDIIMMRIVDLISSLPSLLYMILIMMYLGNSVTSMLIAMSISNWIRTARVVRGEILTLKNLEFVLAARTIGETDFAIIKNQLIPNCLGPIIVTITFLIPGAIFSEAFLSFVGIGIQIPMASWGTLANDAIPMLMSYPYQMFFPAFMISITMFAFNFIGDGLRDSLDPRLKR